MTSEILKGEGKGHNIKAAIVATKYEWCFLSALQNFQTKHSILILGFKKNTIRIINFTLLTNIKISCPIVAKYLVEHKILL